MNIRKLSGRLAILAFVALGSSQAWGWEYPNNPDRFPSVGLSLSGQSVSGEVSYPSAPGAGVQNAELSTGLFILDTRLPLSNSFTLNLALGSAAYAEKYEATQSLNSKKFESKSGGYFSIGARYYFNGGKTRRSESF